MRDRRPKLADTIRWYAEAGLMPRVVYLANGDLAVEAVVGNDPLPNGSKKTQAGSRIDELGALDGASGP